MRDEIEEEFAICHFGSGLVGGKLGTLFARAEHGMVFSYAYSWKRLERLARNAGGKARRAQGKSRKQETSKYLGSS
jgi:hypothetical protein